MRLLKISMSFGGILFAIQGGEDMILRAELFTDRRQSNDRISATAFDVTMSQLKKCLQRRRPLRAK
jgi:hypothetical protein